MRYASAVPVATLLLLAACAPAPAPPPPPPTPQPVAKPAPPPPPVSEDWMDAPRTPGDWSYAGGTATYGIAGTTPAFTFRCDRAAGNVILSRSGAVANIVPMRIMTETATRLLNAVPTGANVSVSLPARDPLLDAIAFSKGRFAIEVPGMPTLYLPSWTEASRVIEDCR